MNVPRCVLPLFTVLVAGACNEADDQAEEPIVRTACKALSNRHFQSEELQTDCGPPGPQPQTCSWSVQFEPSADGMTAYHYNFKDSGESGFVVCEGTIVFEDQVMIGTYLGSSGKLVWHGLTYVRVDE